MVQRIEKDFYRFRQIIRGKIKENLRKYITRGELIGRQGKDIVSIPLPEIEIPHFRYDIKKTGGVGQGEGEVGAPIGVGEAEADGEAGGLPGEHILEVEVSLEELAQMLGEELELPNIKPKGKKNVLSHRDRYKTISQVGPDSLRHFKRTYMQTLKRQVSSGVPVHDIFPMVPIREDFRYRSWTELEDPQSSAVIIYMMDVSGSMGREQKELVRLVAFWIDTWLRYQYKSLEVRYITHDADAREVDQHAFYHTRESGGTRISSAYELCARLIEEQFDPEDWNIYPFHFSDGDNWSGGGEESDTSRCLRVLEKKLLPVVNCFCYGQVVSPYGSGRFLHDLQHQFKDDALNTTEIHGRDDITQAIVDFLGKGK
jgi:sporulation protein YhbH